MNHLQSFKNHLNLSNRNINSFEVYADKTNEQAAVARFVSKILNPLLRKFPKLEEYWLKTLGKPKFSSTSTTKGTPRSASSGLKKTAAMSRGGWGTVASALTSFDTAMKDIAVGEFTNLNKITNLLNNKNCIRSYNHRTKEMDTLLAINGSETKGIYLHELLTLINAWKNNKMMTNDLLECVPESTIDNPNFRLMFKKTLESIGKGLKGEFESRGDFFEYIIKTYPMTKQEAQKIIQDFGGIRKAEEAFKDAGFDFISDSFWFKNGDNVIAAFLRNRFELPVQKYLYHGTTTKNLPGIKMSGLDNSLRGSIPQSNPGSFYASPGHFFGTTEIAGAREFAEWGARRLKAEPVVIRFPNEDGKKFGFGGILKKVGPQKLEYSLDGGKTWNKIQNFK